VPEKRASERKPARRRTHIGSRPQPLKPAGGAYPPPAAPEHVPAHAASDRLSADSEWLCSTGRLQRDYCGAVEWIGRRRRFTHLSTATVSRLRKLWINCDSRRIFRELRFAHSRQSVVRLPTRRCRSVARDWIGPVALGLGGGRSPNVPARPAVTSPPRDGHGQAASADDEARRRPRSGRLEVRPGPVSLANCAL
jgi:hypothetical protein